MKLSGRQKLTTSGVIFALVFCLSARPVLNAADPNSSISNIEPTLADRLFRYATDASNSLHAKSLEKRTSDDYRRTLDAYGQVIRLNTDNYFSAESLARRAELLREMADANGDSAIYQQAIESYRAVVTDHPNSAFVGDSLMGIAQIYEENLQDLDGAVQAYSQLVSYFPESILAREARAVLARFESQLKNRPIDVLTSNDQLSPAALSRMPLLTNVRSFSGPDYARVVIDLSKSSSYSQRRDGNRITIQLAETVVSRSLSGRRFLVGDQSLLKRISVSQLTQRWGIQIDLDVRSFGSYSSFALSDPDRIIIDLHSSAAPSEKSGATPKVDRIPITHGATVEKQDTPARARSIGGPDKSATMSLPEISDPIVPMTNPSQTVAQSQAAAAAQALSAKIEAKEAAGGPIKRIVIDPGHGGHDTGTISANGMREKDLVLDVGRRLKNYIKSSYPEIEVIMTRDSDRFVALEERTAIANSRRADLFISIHANASPSRVASGVETFFLSPDRAPAEDLQAAARENARLASDKASDKPEPMFASVTVGNRVSESKELARYIQAGLVRGIGAASPRTAMNRGVKHAPFVVLLGAAMPSVLAEVSFLSNPKDEALLQTGQFRERVAASLFAGLNAYLKKNQKPENKTK
jgi:N-acetylmuramoyl-L-alanine amidase